VHYGIGPEIYAKYRRGEIAKAAPITRHDPVRDADTSAHEQEPAGGLLGWIGAMLIAAGTRLAGDVRQAGRDVA
jgi:hypothetical protein